MKVKGQKLKETFYPESKFGGFSNVDGTIAFYLRVNALIEPGSTVIDFGCGRGAYGEDPIAIRRELRILKGKAGSVIGLDVEGSGAENPFLDDFQRLGDKGWPMPDGSADLVLCDSVLEHLPNPKEFFSEARRVLRSGGVVCIRTPNLWGYVAFLSRLVPNRVHSRVLTKVKEGTQERDTFPTLFRCNTIPKINNMMKACNFDSVVYGYGPEPSYLTISKPIYGLGFIYQRVAPHFLQPVIFAFGKAA
jgi:SAM-dependent methyltransferase